MWYMGDTEDTTELESEEDNITPLHFSNLHLQANSLAPLQQNSTGNFSAKVGSTFNEEDKYKEKEAVSGTTEQDESHQLPSTFSRRRKRKEDSNVSLIDNHPPLSPLPPLSLDDEDVLFQLELNDNANEMETAEDLKKTNERKTKKEEQYLKSVHSDAEENLDVEMGLGFTKTVPDAIENDRRSLSDFLESHICENLIPESGKIVVLDTSLAVKAAFHALEENNIKSAPLWDSTVQDYVGIITVSDFIEILLHFHNKIPQVNVFEELEKHQIKTWREIISTTRPTKGLSKLIYANPEDTLHEASQTLLKHRIHRLPIIDRAESNTILHIMTHYRILSFLIETLKEKPGIFSCSIEALGIGTFKNVVTVLEETPINVVLTLLAERKISAVPVVDENGTVIDVYSRSDVTALVKQVNFNFLDNPVGEILEYKKKDRVYTCQKTETLYEVLKRLIETRVYRLICVDFTNRVEGIVSLSDILKAFLV